MSTRSAARKLRRCGSELLLEVGALQDIAVSGATRAEPQGRVLIACQLDEHLYGGQHCWRGRPGVVILWGTP